MGGAVAKQIRSCCGLNPKSSSKYEVNNNRPSKNPQYNEDQDIIENSKQQDQIKSIYELNKYAQDIQLNEKTSECLKNQRIVILISQTGMGKTTCANYLRGKQLVLKNGKFIVVNGDNEFKISDSCKSETRKVSQFQLENIYVCDAPGLGDSKGYLQDIINTKNILDAINSSKQFNFALIITPHIFDRANGSFIKIIQSFTKYIKDIKRCFLLIINKVQDSTNDIENIQSFLYEYSQNQEKIFNKLEKQIIEKIQEMIQNKQYLILKPEDQNKIKEHTQQILQLKLYKNQFSISDIISQDSKNYFQEMIRNCFCYLKDLIKKNEKNSEIENIFQNILAVNRFMKDEIIEIHFYGLLEFMKNQLQAKMTEINDLVKIISNDEIDDLTSLICKMLPILETQFTLSQLLQKQLEGEDFKSYFEKILGQIMNQSDYLVNSINSSENVSQISRLFLKLQQIYAKEELNNLLNQIKSKYQIQDCGENYLEKAEEAIEKIYNNYFDCIYEIIKEKKLSLEAVQNLNYILSFIQQFQSGIIQKFTKFSHLRTFEDIQKQFSNSIKQFEKSISRNKDFSFEQGSQEYKKLSIFNEDNKMFYEFIINFYRCINKNDQFQGITQIIQNIQSYLQNLIKDFLSHISRQDNINAISDLMIYLEQLTNLNKSFIEEISTHNIYASCKKNLQKLFAQEKMNFKDFLNRIFENIEIMINNAQQSTLDDKTLKEVTNISKSLSNLKKSSIWIDQFENNFQSIVNQKANDKLGNRLKNNELISSERDEKNCLSTQSQYQEDSFKDESEDLFDTQTQQCFYQKKEQSQESIQFKEQYQQQLIKLKNDDSIFCQFDSQKFKRIQFVSQIIFSNEQNDLTFPTLDSKFFSYLSSKLINEQYFADVNFNNFKELMQQVQRIQDICQYKEFLQNFKSHIYAQLIQYKNSINRDDRSQQFKIQQKYDFEYLTKINVIVQKIMDKQIEYKNQIDQIIKKLFFEQKDFNLITNFRPEQLKLLFDDLKWLFNQQGIKLIFESTSLYDKYQQQLIEELSKLNKQMDEKKKKNEHVHEILLTFQEFGEQLRDHISQEFEFSEDMLDAQIEENMGYQKLIFKLMVDRCQYDQLLKKQIEIQNKELKKYIDEALNTQIKEFQIQLEEITQICYKTFSAQTFETILGILKKCQNFFSIFENCYKTQLIDIKVQLINLNQMIIQFALEKILENKDIQMINLIKEVIKFKDFYDENRIVQILQNQIQEILNDIENDIDFCEKGEKLGYNVGKIRRIKNFLQELELDLNKMNIENSTSSIAINLQNILEDQIILFIYDQKNFDKQSLQNMVSQSLKEEFEFLKYDQQKINKICLKCLSKVEDQLENLRKMLCGKDFKQIKEKIDLLQIKSSPLIEEKIYAFLTEIENDIFIIHLGDNNFQKINKLFQQLKELNQTQFFTQSDVLKQKIKNINKKFDEQIQRYLNQQIIFSDANSFKKSLQNVNKLIQLHENNLPNIQNYQIPEKLFEQMSKPILNLYQILNNAIEQFKVEDIQKCFNDLNTINTQKIDVKNNQNFFQLFNQLCISIFQKQNHQSNEYSKIFIKPAKQVIQELAKAKQEQLTVEKTIKHLQLKEYSQIIQQQLQYETYCKRIQDLITLDQNIIVNEVEKHYEIEKQNTEIYLRDISQNINQVMSKEAIFQQIESNFQDLSSRIKNNPFSKYIQTQLANFVDYYQKKLNELVKDFSNKESQQKFAQQLIELYKLSLDHKSEYLQSQCVYMLRQAIKDQKSETVQNLIYILKLDKLGSQITKNHDDIFYEFEVLMYNKSTQNQNNLLYTAQNIKCDNDPTFDKVILEQQFDAYLKITTQINTNILTEQYDIIELQNKVINMAEAFKNNKQYLSSGEIVWSESQKQQLIEILSYISSVWSIQNNEKGANTKRYVHVVQIVAIMRILNIDIKQQSKLQNHLLQIKTGEGKSIIIGIASTILALIGFQVDCCCYSPYLSQRDQKSFQSFFELFNVQDKIQYNTFEKLTEKMFNSPYNLRELGEQYIFQRKQKILQSTNIQGGKKILIIDEVDFFFNKEFLGNTYPVALQISNPEIIELFKYIWKRRYLNISLNKVQQSNEYRNLFANNQNLKHLTNLIDIKIEQMIQDAKNMEDHSYILSDVPDSQDKMIGYKQFNGYRYDIVKRYKTSFAYYVEYQLKHIQKSQLCKVLNFNFNLGCFSYRKILDQYCTVIGVSGTLEQLENYQKDQMKKFNITKQTILPSVFGKTHLKFEEKDVYIIQEKEEYFKQISQQINDEIKKKRAVIVFFENQHKMNEFKQQFKAQGKCEIQILDEQTNDKQHIINMATNSQTLTLSTKSYGRGTDFKCYDETVKINGGIHVIQTFLSETVTELIQTQGRSARNGEDGSYSLIILLKTLEVSFGFKGNIQHNNKYNQLKGIISKSQECQGQKLDQQIKESEDLHQKSFMLKELLQKYYLSESNLEKQINNYLKEISDLSDSKDSHVSHQSQINNLDIKNAERDEFGDPIGQEFDLAKDGSCSQKKVLIGQFVIAKGCDVGKDLQLEFKQALKQKGYLDFQIEDDEEPFINKIKDYDQIQIFSGSRFKNKNFKDLEGKFVEEILNHLKKGRGLMLWCDNDPFYYHANLILNKIPIGYEDQQPIYMNLQGNDYANGSLNLGQNDIKNQFGSHPIVKGLDGIFEGNTICYPKIKDNMKSKDNYEDFGDLEIVGTGSEERPCMFVLNATKYRGRIVFDCGFTKILSQYWNKNRGTQRYVQNCYCWLNYIDQAENI